MTWNGTGKGARRPRPAYRRALERLGVILTYALVVGIGIVTVFQLGYDLGSRL